MIKEADSNTKGIISTEEFRLGSTPHAREALAHWAGRFWFIVAAPIAALAIYGIWFDWRYMVVTACVIFRLFPTCAMVAFNMVLTSPSAIRSMFPQKVTIDPQGNITVTYSPLTPDDKVPGKEAPATLYIPRDAVTTCRYWNHYTVLKYGEKETLMVPDKAFRTHTEATEFYLRLNPEEE